MNEKKIRKLEQDAAVARVDLQRLRDADQRAGHAGLHREHERALRDVERQYQAALANRAVVDASAQAEAAGRLRAQHASLEWDLRAARLKFAGNSAAHAARAGQILRDHDFGYVPDAEYKVFLNSARTAVECDQLDRRLAKLQRRHARAAVTHEPGPYEAGSPHSWVDDMVACSVPNQTPMVDVSRRIAAHSHDVTEALGRGGRYGRQIRSLVRESSRCEDRLEHRRVFGEELRSLSSGGGGQVTGTSGAAAFVPPAILLDAWVKYRSPYAAFANQCNSDVPLPDFGLEVAVPQVTAPTAVAIQAEGEPVGEADPTITYLTAPVVMLSGLLTVSRQVRERTGPGITADQFLFGQLREQLDAKVGAYALAQATAGAETVTNTGTFALSGANGLGGLLKDIRSARKLLTDLAGTRLRATHMFATPDVTDYLLALADGQGRPIVTPALDDNRLPIRSTGDMNAEGYTGYVLAGLAVFADNQIQPSGDSGADETLIIARTDTIMQMVAAPIFTVYPQEQAGTLQDQVIARQYVATLPRFPQGVATITGAAYATSVFS